MQEEILSVNTLRMRSWKKKKSVPAGGREEGQKFKKECNIFLEPHEKQPNLYLFLSNVIGKKKTFVMTLDSWKCGIFQCFK